MPRADELIVGGVAAAGAAALAWWLLRGEPEPLAPAQPLPQPLAQPQQYRLAATGDGMTFAAAAETRAAIDALWRGADRECDKLRRKSGKCAVRCRLCKKRAVTRRNKAIAEAAMRAVGTTRGATATAALQAVGGLVSAAGEAVGSVYGAQTPNLSQMGTTTAPGGAQVIK